MLTVTSFSSMVKTSNSVDFENIGILNPHNFGSRVTNFSLILEQFVYTVIVTWGPPHASLHKNRSSMGSCFLINIVFPVFF